MTVTLFDWATDPSCSWLRHPANDTEARLANAEAENRQLRGLIEALTTASDVKILPPARKFFRRN